MTAPDAYQQALRAVVDQFVQHRFDELARAYPDRLVLQIDLQDWLNVRVGSATAPRPAVDPRDFEHPEVAQRRAEQGQPMPPGSFDLEHTP